MSSSGTTGSDGRTYSSDGKGNITVVDNSGKTVYSGSGSNSGANSPSYGSAPPKSSYNGNPSDADLYAGNFHENYITGNKLWVDPRVNNAQRAMIQSNFYAQQAGNAAPYSQDQVSGASGGGYAGYSYSPGNMGDRYSYVAPYKTGGQNFISPTQRTDQAGRTVEYRGYANEPDLGRYATGVSSPQDMDYSWERTGGYDDLRAGTFKFNPEGAAAVAARDITSPTNVYTQTMQLLNTARGGDGTGGYYDDAKGYYTGAPGSSDMQRTFDAIDYYRQNNMLDKLQAAQDYANRQGYVNNASNAHLQSSDWVGNAYPGARWDPASRSIVTGDGRALREGVDFAIGSDDRAYVLPGAGARTVLAPGVTVPAGNASAARDVYNTSNEWLGAWKDMQNQYANAMPPFNPPERESFRFTTPPPSITSGGGDIHIPTLAAKQQWEAEQDAVQNQYAQKYGANYNRAQDIYGTQLDLLKAGMTDTMRQEEIAREAARYQAEVALEREKDKYNRALAMWQSGVGTDEIYRTLGIPAGTRPFEQLMAEWKMELTEREFAMDAAKAARSGGGGSHGGGSSSGGGNIYSAALNEMLAGQSRHRQALISGEKRSPHSYNYYVSQAIELSNQAGRPLSRTEIDALRRQADYLTKTDDDWVKAQIAAGRLPQRRPITDNYRE